MKISRIIDNVNDISVSGNELLVQHVINRNLKLLLDNDIKLDIAKDQLLKTVSIHDWVKGITYKYGDLVWYKQPGSADLWLLMAIDDTQDDPNVALNDRDDNDEPLFQKHGWKDENRQLNIFALGLQARLHSFVREHLQRHEVDNEFHLFGKLTKDVQQLDTKLLKADFSNINPMRENNFFPYVTHMLKPTDSILQGYCRIWDKGILEYDIVIQLGFDSKYQKMPGIPYGRKVLHANTLTMTDGQNFSPNDGDNYNENYRYFMTMDDYAIFNHPSSLSSVIGETIQMNRNDYVNVYSAQIDFPNDLTYDNQRIGFKDLNYMVFTTDIMCQCIVPNQSDPTNLVLVPNANCMTFCNKHRNHITALLVTHTSKKTISEQKFNAEHGGLAANSFHCQIIGRWK